MNEVERFRRTREIFAAARRLGSDERRVYLDRECGDDADLRAELDALLHKHDDPSSMLDDVISDAAARVSSSGSGQGATSHAAESATPATGGRGAASDPSAPASGGVPDRIGSYRILRRLGSGGMGTVYEAEQGSPRRIVALKVMHVASGSDDLLRRFRNEAEILGRLQHPAIARVYEAATFDAGRPYFAMERIDGLPLNRYATENELGLRARLELLADVADAVDHAHQNGIIHRDLKPSNILVDREGRPHVLDFGIARADAMLTTLQTRTGQLVGTLPYMSPEQVSGDAKLVDRRSDVYALGVLAYELLAGRLPLDVRGMAIPDAALMIREHDPEGLATLSRELRGDLDTIVMTAIDKDPQRRYAGAAAFADDVRRFLDDRTIVARPASTIYRTRKFVRRHRVLVGALGAIIVILTGATVFMSIALARALDAEATARKQEGIAQEALAAAEDARGRADAARARADDARDAARIAQARAEEEAAIAEAVNDFLNQDLLAAVDPGRTRDREITMREVLDIAAAKIEGRFEDQPRVAARVRETLAVTYQRLGELGRAETHFLAARATLEAGVGEHHPDTLAILNSLSTLYLDDHRHDEAEELLLQLIDVYRSRPDLSESDFLRVMSNYGGLLLSTARLDEALPVLEENLEQKRRVFGDEDASTLTTMNNLAGLYLELYETERAIELYRKALAGRTALYGEDHPRTLGTASSLGWALTRADRTDEAVELLEPTVRLLRVRTGDDHPQVAQVLATLCFAHQIAERWQSSLDAIDEAIRIRLTQFGPDHPQTLMARSNRALSLIHLDRDDEVEALFEDLLPRERRVFPADHWEHGNTALTQAQYFLRHRRYEEAESVLLRARRIFVDSLGLDHPSTLEAASDLAEAYDGLGRPEEAARWRDVSAEGRR